MGGRKGGLVPTCHIVPMFHMDFIICPETCSPSTSDLVTLSDALSGFRDKLGFREKKKSVAE